MQKSRLPWLRGSLACLALVAVAACSDEVDDAPTTTVITGRVVDASNQPVADAQVSTVPTTQTVSTDPDGRFRIEGASFTQSYTVTAEKGGFQLASVNITPSATGTNEVALVLDVIEICTPDQRRCVVGGGQAFEVCNAQGNGFNDPVSCGTGQVCEEGRCTGEFILTVTPSAFGVIRTEAGLAPVINCGETCVQSYPVGAQVRLTAIELARGRFEGWTDDCAAAGTATECVVTMDADREVSADFVQFAFPVSVSRAGNGDGRVTSTPAGIDCGSTCTADFERNVTVELVAVPEPGSEFERWERACSGTAPTCTLTIDDDQNVRARFREPTFALTVSRVGTGTGRVTSSPGGIDCGTDCEADLPQNSQVTLTAEPANGSTFEGWSGGGCSGTLLVCTLTLDSARTVQARFDGITFPLAVTKLGAGAGTVTSDPPGIDCGTTCTAPFGPDTEVTLTAAAAADAGFAGWGDGCAAEGTNPQCTVTITAAVAVSATFEPYFFFPLPAQPECVALLSFDGATPLAHRCGSGADGSVQGTGAYQQVASRSSFLDQAYAPVGVDPVGAIDSGRSMPAPPAATIELTVRRDGAAFDGGGEAVLVSDIDRSLPDGGLRLVALDDGGVAIQTWQGGAVVATATAAGALPVGQWTHIAATVSTADGLTLFVDGQAVETLAGPVGWTASSSTAWVTGERDDPSGAGRRLNGAVDEVRLTTGVPD